MAEHRAAVTSELEVFGWPSFAFNLSHVPKQQLRKHVDYVITEAHFQFLPKNRSALAAMHSFDKVAYFAAILRGKAHPPYRSDLDLGLLRRPRTSTRMVMADAPIVVVLLVG